MHYYANQARDQIMLLPLDRAPGDAEAGLVHLLDYAMRSREANDVVFLGDSTCAYGVATNFFQTRTGISAYNLGALGAVGIDGLVVILRHYLEHHPRPRLVVLCVEPHALDINYGRSVLRHRLLDIFGAESRKWRWSKLSLDYLADEAKLGMRGLLGTAVQTPTDVQMAGSNAQTTSELWRKLTTLRGYWGAWTTTLDQKNLPPPPSVELPAELADANLTYDVAGDPDRKKNIEDILHLTSKYDVPLLIRLTPVVAGRNDNDHTKLISWLQSLEQQYPGKFLLGQPGILRYPRAKFGDVLHLNRAGAAQFTAFLSNEIPRCLAALTASDAAQAQQDCVDSSSGSSTDDDATVRPTRAASAAATRIVGDVPLRQPMASNVP